VYRERHFLRLRWHTWIIGSHQRRGAEGENQHWRKEMVIHKERLFWKITEPLQHRWQQTLLPQKLPYVSFTRPTSTVGLQLLNLWLLKVMLRCINNGVTTIKPVYQTNGKARVIWSGESSFTSPLHQEKFMFGEHARKPIIRNAWFQQCNTGGSVMVWAEISWYSILRIALLPFMAELLQGRTWTG
jgi:hypothetical protein